MPRSSIQRLPGRHHLEPEPDVVEPLGRQVGDADGRRGPVGPRRQLGAADEGPARRLPLDPDPDLGVGAVGAEPGLDRQARLDARGEAIADGGRGGHPGVQPEAGAARMRLLHSRSRRRWPGRRRPASRRGPRRPARRPARPRASGPARIRGWAGPSLPRGGAAVQPGELAGELVVARLHAGDDRLGRIGGHRSQLDLRRPDADRGDAEGGQVEHHMAPPGDHLGDQAKPPAQVVDGRRGGAVSTVSSRIG